MSLRRKSCDACFKGRRKCDRDYPSCGTCQRTKKRCHYAYAPVSSASLSDNPASTDADAADGVPTDSEGICVDLAVHSSNPRSGQTSVPEGVPEATHISTVSLPRTSAAQFTSSSSVSSGGPPTLPRLNIPNFLGVLGEIQRIEGSTDSWQWVIGQLRRCPRDFATLGETLFLHKNLYHDAMPRSIRAAMGSSAIFCTLDEDKSGILFRSLDAEVLELLDTSPLLVADENREFGGVGNSSILCRSGLSLIEELARLQAMTLYQMIRIFSGGLEQRLVVDHQRGLVTTWALQLLRRSRAELGGQIDSWNTWILAESIRRTVLVVYMFYGMYSLATEGFCAEIPTLAKLPVSATPSSWHSEAAYLAHSRGDKATNTMTYEDFTNLWAVSRPQRLDPFSKLLVAPCKGLEEVIS